MTQVTGSHCSLSNKNSSDIFQRSNEGGKKINAPLLLQQTAPPPAVRKSYSRVKICKQYMAVHLNRITFKDAYSVSKAPSRRGTSNSKGKSHRAQHYLLTLLQTSNRQATSLANPDSSLLQQHLTSACEELQQLSAHELKETSDVTLQLFREVLNLNVKVYIKLVLPATRGGGTDL